MGHEPILDHVNFKTSKNVKSLLKIIVNKF